MVEVPNMNQSHSIDQKQALPYSYYMQVVYKIGYTIINLITDTFTHTLHTLSCGVLYHDVGALACHSIDQSW